jgi:alkaline phosphatase D
MKRMIGWLGLLLPGVAAMGQNTFNHGPDQGIEAQYFDTTLAPFYHGVASGDPLDDRVIIWTRVTPPTDTIVPVHWKVALDTAFTQIVAQGSLVTDYTKDYTVKADVTGLQPGVTYYYYFSALNKNSLIGRTHTLPVSTVQHLRFAVVSCSNYQMGYFNAYKRIAERNDLDAVLHLGDYIYEYATYGYGYTAAVDRKHQPDNVLLTLDDYRIRHSFYKLDADLRAAHQQHPFITIWDDHEIVNNTYEKGAQSHDTKTQGDYETRKQNAIRSYLEWMPIRHPDFVHNARIYRRFTFGNLADLLMLDTRDEARDPQAPNAASPVLNDSTRRLLGDTQRIWMFDNMAQSPATWRILGNQIMFSQDGHAPDLDAWTGYPAERKMVLDGLRNQRDKNNIILTGDTHRSWAFDLTEFPFDSSKYQPLTGKGTFGVELATPSVASPNRDESSPGTSPIPAQTALYQENPQLRYTDLDNHGYFVMDITPVKTQADFYIVDTKVRSSNETFIKGLFTYVNQGYLQDATSPASPKTYAPPAAPDGPAGFPIAPTPTGIKNVGTAMVSGVYPNPAQDKLFLGLVLNTGQQVSLHLSDINGRVLQSRTYNLAAGNHTIALAVQDLPAGMYLLQVKEQNGVTQSRKVMVQ